MDSRFRGNDGISSTACKTVFRFSLERCGAAALVDSGLRRNDGLISLAHTAISLRFQPTL
jgi:hypothetical protein